MQDRSRTAAGGGGRGLAVGGGAGGLAPRDRARAARRQPAGRFGSVLARAGVRRSPRPSCRRRAETGSDANQREDCRIVGVVNSVQELLERAARRLPRGADALLHRPDLDRLRRRDAQPSARSTARPTRPSTSTSASTTSCAPASARKGGPFAEAYVIAHEYGHHVQHLLGTDERVGNDREGETSGSVRLELQADCYAGVWAAHAVETGYIEDLTQRRHRRRARRRGRRRRRPDPGAAPRGRVDPESWTHGSSASRQKWFNTGYRDGDPRRCDTFAAGALCRSTTDLGLHHPTDRSARRRTRCENRRFRTPGTEADADWWRRGA